MPATLSDRCIMWILARRSGDDAKLRREHGRQILHRVDGDVDAPLEQRLLQLLDEEALAADIGERGGENFIAAGVDWNDFDREARRRGGNGVAHHLGLDDRKLAGPRSDSERRFHGSTTS